MYNRYHSGGMRSTGAITPCQSPCRRLHPHAHAPTLVTHSCPHTPNYHCQYQHRLRATLAATRAMGMSMTGAFQYLFEDHKRTPECRAGGGGADPVIQSACHHQRDATSPSRRSSNRCIKYSSAEGLEPGYRRRSITSPQRLPSIRRGSAIRDRVPSFLTCQAGL